MRFFRKTWMFIFIVVFICEPVLSQAFDDVSQNTFTVPEEEACHQFPSVFIDPGDLAGQNLALTQAWSLAVHVVVLKHNSYDVPKSDVQWAYQQALQLMTDIHQHFHIAPDLPVRVSFMPTPCSATIQNMINEGIQVGSSELARNGQLQINGSGRIMNMGSGPGGQPGFDEIFSPPMPDFTPPETPILYPFFVEDVQNNGSGQGEASGSAQNPFDMGGNDDSAGASDDQGYDRDYINIAEYFEESNVISRTKVFRKGMFDFNFLTMGANDQQGNPIPGNSAYLAGISVSF